MSIDFNVNPYYDDFDVNKGYLKLLFKPGNSVQARELTQIQSVLQSQISSLADHFFKEGAMVVPGQAAVDVTAEYVRIGLNGASSYNTPADFVGKVVTGSITGAQALVVHYENKTGDTVDDDPDTLFVKYLTGASSDNVTLVEGQTFNFAEGQTTQFISGEVLVASGTDLSLSCLVSDGVIEPSCGLSSIAFIEDGIYYIQGKLLRVFSQKIVLDKYSDKPSYQVGLEFVESVVSAEEDPTLLDNSQGTTNYNAPGADRYKTNLVFTKRDLSSIDTKNFIKLITVNNGVIEQKVRSTDYSILEETLAIRTYDESGDYTVKAFKLDVRDMYNDGTNRGVYTIEDFEYETELAAQNVAKNRFADDPGMVDAVTGEGLAHLISDNDVAAWPEQNLSTIAEKYYPGRSHQALMDALESRLALGLEAGKAYVRGYEIYTLVTSYVDYKKSRETLQRNNRFLNVNLGNFIYVTDLQGLPEIDSEVYLTNINVKGKERIVVEKNFTITDDATDIYENYLFGDDSIYGSDVVATAKIKFISSFSNENSTENADYTKSIFIGTSNLIAPTIYKLYLYDIQYRKKSDGNDFYNINDVRSIVSHNRVSVASNVPIFSCNTLSQYTLIDLGIQYEVGQFLYNVYGGSDRIGVVYDIPTPNTILVKTIGFGYKDAIGSWNRNSFEPNTYIDSIAYSTDQATTGTLFDGNENYYVQNNISRIFDKQVLFDTDGSSIIPFYENRIQTVRSIDDVSGRVTLDTTYIVQKDFSPQTTDESGNITLALSEDGNEIFDQNSYNIDRLMVFTTPTSDSSLGNIIPINLNNVSVSPSGYSMTISLGSSYPNKTVDIFTTTIKTESREKLKTLVETKVLPYSLLQEDGSSLEVSSYSNTTGADNTTTTNNYLGDIIGSSVTGFSLGYLQMKHSDIYKVNGVYDTCDKNNIAYIVNIFGDKKFIHEMTFEDCEFAVSAYEYFELTGSSPYSDIAGPFATLIEDAGGPTTPGLSTDDPTKLINVTTRYEFDNGQRPGIYKIGSLSIKKGQSVCAGRAIVFYSYFQHSSGDYCSVDSYTNSGVSYEDIPSYNGVRLSDVLDFRPVTTYKQNTVNTGNGDVLLGYGVVETTENYYPLSGTNISCDYRFYLPRKDKLYLDKNGVFDVKYGAPSLNPLVPENPDDGMVLYNISTNAYTLGPDDIEAEMVENKRYTMRDIGSLERRIANLEYYTTLSLLEKETNDMKITDENGMERFKNGFVVEPFKGHNIGDVFDLDYNCSIDSVNGILRPKFTEQFTNMDFSWSSSENFSLNDGILTLPFTESLLISQDKSSKTVNVNPFAIFSFRGSVKLIPESDEWRDVNRRPDLVINRNSEYDNIKFLADKTGILGTDWNNWQTSWTGTATVSTSPSIVRTQQTISGRNLVTRTTSSQTVTTSRDFTSIRRGVSTTLVPKVVTENLGDRLVNTEMVPYMRSREVFFIGKRLKPNTKLYAFFDTVDVTTHCSGASVLNISTTDTNFTANEFVAANRDKFTAEVGGVRIRGGVSNKQVTVYGIDSDGTNLNFYVKNNLDSKTFQSGETLYVVDSSGSRLRVGKFDSLINENSSLVSDSSGTIYGIFNIPNNDNIRFRTGERVFRLIDQPNNSDNDADTSAQAIYSARGIIETRQQTILSTRTANFSQRDVSEVRSGTTTTTSVRTATNVVSTRRWVDPLAETIMIDLDGGAFISSVDLFFSTKDASIPVTLEIRNTVNGYPGQKVVATKTIYPDSVYTSDDGTYATNFKFDSLVYLQDGTEYCIVVLADTQEYRVHVARLGEQSLDGSGVISQQPYAGVFFKSQNASTWTADQMEDLKFKIYRAKFDTSVTGQVFFANTDNDISGTNIRKIYLDEASIETIQNSSKVIIHAKNHGMVPDTPYSWVEIYGLKSDVRYGFSNSGTATNEITGSAINGVHKVIASSLDKFVIDLNANSIIYKRATSYTDEAPVWTANTGSTYVADVSGVYPAVSDLAQGAFIDSNIKYDLLMPIVQNVEMPGTSLSYEFTSLSGISQDGTSTPGIKDYYWSVFTPNENIEFLSPRYIANKYNQKNNNTGSGIFKSSLLYRVKMSSTKDNLSPQIDTRRTSAILISNRINNPTGDSALNGYVSADLGGFIPETNANGGSIDMTYITREITLLQPSKAFRVILTVNRPAAANYDIYYKTKKSDGEDYRGLEYTLVDRPDGYSISSRGPDEFFEIEYDVSDLEEFVSFGIKIVMTSENSCDIPKITDMRIIALAA